jgi:hypothetical protein
MNIYAKKGTKVYGLFDKNGKCQNGYDFDKERVEQLLKPDVAYTVERTEVSQSSTAVYLQEFPNKVFNSVCLIDDFEKFNLNKPSPPTIATDHTELWNINPDHFQNPFNAEQESPEDVVKFLCGEAPLKGHWYGEDVKPAFWWRKHLREAFSKPVVASTEDQEESQEYIMEEFYMRAAEETFAELAKHYQITRNPKQP